MSDPDQDTDDTDILLNSDPLGGLFKGLSLKQLADKHKEIMMKGEGSLKETLASAPPETGTEDHESSDFFNSQGELQFLSDLSEFADSEFDADKSDEEGGGFTYTPSLREDQDKDKDKEKKKEEQESNSGDQNKDKEENKDPLVPFMPKFLNHGTVIDINLQNPATNWNIPLPSFLQSEGGSCAFINDKGEQVFTRAPNFRTKGGYKPQQNQGCRDLTDQQVLEQTKDLYSQEAENEDFQPTLLPLPVSADSFASHIENTLRNDMDPEGQKVRFSFISENMDPNLIQFQSGEEMGKPIARRKLQAASKGKRKHTKFEGAGDCASTTTIDLDSSSSSSPNRCQSTPYPNPIVNGESKIGDDQVIPSPHYSTRVIRGMKRGMNKSNPTSLRSRGDAYSGGAGASGFSFGYNENELSPIKSESEPAGRRRTVGFHPNPPEEEEEGGFTSLHELNSIWREIQSSRARLKHLFGNDPVQDNVDVNPVTPSPIQVRQVEKAKEPAPVPKTSNSRPSFMVSALDQFDTDLELLLHDADINPVDFDEIVEDLDIGGLQVGEGIEDLLNEIVVPSSESKDGQDHEEVSISHWAKSGAVEYVEKYHEEKLRREECEDEIARLNQQILEIRQDNAVIKGTCKRKDATIAKISKDWKTLSEDWKKFENVTKLEMDKLKKQHSELSHSFAQSQQRIQDYEKELEKSIEVADHFKNQLKELQESKDGEMAKFKEEIANLDITVVKLSKTVSEVTEEKKSAIRALKESQHQMDQLRTSLSKVESELRNLKTHDVQIGQDLKEALNQKSRLDGLLKIQSKENEELLNKVNELSSQVEILRNEKAKLRQDFDKTTRQLVSEEQHRLHQHYNKKIQETLEKNAQMHAKNQSLLMDEINQIRTESERKLAVCKERFHSDLTRMKTIYETEIQELKRDNLKKEVLINQTIQQLQQGGALRSDAMNRLQSLVSNLPVLNHSGQGDSSSPLAIKNPSPSSLPTKDCGYSKFAESLKSINLQLQFPSASSDKLPSKIPKFSTPSPKDQQQPQLLPGKPMN